MRSQHEDKIQAAILLQQDIMNCANHCFGIHRNCKPEYCKTAKSKTTNTSHANGQANASSSYTPPQNFDKVSMPSASTQTSPILHLPEDPPEYTEMDVDSIDQLLREQQCNWEDATDSNEITDNDENLDPSQPVDEEMICDINAIDSQLASKSQLLGKQTY